MQKYLRKHALDTKLYLLLRSICVRIKALAQREILKTNKYNCRKLTCFGFPAIFDLDIGLNKKTLDTINNN